VSGVSASAATDPDLAIGEALCAVDFAMVATVPPKDLLSLSYVYARVLALTRAGRPASVLQEVSRRKP
jgi:hypothetical protein